MPSLSPLAEGLALGLATLVGGILVACINAWWNTRVARRALEARQRERDQDHAAHVGDQQATFTAKQLELLYTGQWARIEELKTALAGVEPRIVERDGRIDALEVSLEDVRENLAQIRVIERALRNENTQLRTRVQQLTDENALLHARVAQLEQRVTDRAAPAATVAEG